MQYRAVIGSAPMWAAQRSTASFPNRHDALFMDLGDALAGIPSPKVLSFGCSKGFEPLDLARLISGAQVLGCDVDEKALAEARERCEPAITIFASSAGSLAEHGLYDAVVAMSVVTRYPSIQDKDDISAIYPFSAFEGAVESIASQITRGGVFLLYNACYAFEQTRAAQEFEPVASLRHKNNGWIDKYDRSGLRLTKAEGEQNGQRIPIHTWRTQLWEEAHRDENWAVFENSPYFQTAIRPKIAVPDLQTVMWRKVI